MHVVYEDGFDNDTLDALSQYGHQLYHLAPENGYSAVTAISRTTDLLEAVPDGRRHGSADMY